MRNLTHWPGTQADMLALIDAVQHNCTCATCDGASAVTSCAAHALLTADQQAINRLAFVRSIADRLRAEEWCVSKHTAN